MKLTEIADNAGSRKKRMRVGRGIGSGKGKTAGRGGKGQTARKGGAKAGFEGGQNPFHRRIPQRGFRHTVRRPHEIINVDTLEAAFNEGETINLESLQAKGLARGLGVDIQPEVVDRYRAGDIRHCVGNPERMAEVLGFRAEMQIDDGLAQLATALELEGARGLVLFNRFFQPDIDPYEVTVRPHLRLSEPGDQHAGRPGTLRVCALDGRLKIEPSSTNLILISVVN